MKLKKITFLLMALVIMSLMIITSCSKKENPENKLGEDSVKDLNPYARYAELNLSEYIKIGQYLGLELISIDPTVSDEQLNNYINELLAQNKGTNTVTDRAVASGDTVMITYDGKLDDMDTPEGLSTGETQQSLEIGSGVYIAGFEDGLIGVMPGETVELHLVFPEVYSFNEDLAGHPVTFTVTVHGISVPFTPELDDYFVASISDYNTVDEFKSATKLDLYAENVESAKAELISYIWTTVQENSEIIKYPQEMIDMYITDMNDYYTEYAQYNGYESLEVMLSEQYGKTLDEFKEESLSYAQDTISEEMVLYSIAKAENLWISQEEYDSGLQKYTTLYGYATTAEFEEEYGEPMIRQSLLWDKTLEYLYTNALFVD